MQKYWGKSDKIFVLYYVYVDIEKCSHKLNIKALYLATMLTEKDQFYKILFTLSNDTLNWVAAQCGCL